MKVVITDAPAPTPEDIEDMKARSQEASPEQAATAFAACKEIRIPRHVMEKLKAMGMTPDELIAGIMKNAGKLN